MRRSTPIVLAAACALALPAGAHAATLAGTVTAPPTLTKLSAVVPVVDAKGTTRKVVVPVKDAIRSKNGRLTAGQLRYGDAITATGTKKKLAGSHPRATTLKVGTRSAAPSFDQIRANLKATTDSITAAQAQLATLPTDVDQITALGEAPAEVRNRLFDVRAKVNDIISDLRVEADTLDAIGKAAPKATGLSAAATTARDAADKLDDAVAQLDTTINAVGGTSPPPLLPGGVSTVSDVFQLVLNVISHLPGGIGKV